VAPSLEYQSKGGEEGGRWSVEGKGKDHQSERILNCK